MRQTWEKGEFSAGFPQWAHYQVAEKHLHGRLIKNVQMQGIRNSEE
jgi:hypothetical protein